MLSSTAENLFWLSRYVERADNTARVIDAASRLSSLPTTYAGVTNAWESALAATGGAATFAGLYDSPTADNVIDFLAISANNPSSIRRCLETARATARSVRIALTGEMWETINGAWLELKRFERIGGDRGRLNALISHAKETSLRFDGSAYRTMLRNDAYFFSRLGVFLERADNTARILDVKYHLLLPESTSVGGGIDYFQWSSILRAVSALTAYHWVYRDSVKPWLVADLLILNSEMPRSLTSCYVTLCSVLEELSRAYGKQGPAQRLARSMRNKLENTDIGRIFSGGLHEFLTDFIVENGRLGDTIATQYLG